MFCEDVCYGTACGMVGLRNLNDALNAKVVDEINGSQELVMLTSFARESHEYQFKKCLQDRISDVASWHWVLVDLSKRLEDAIESLKYEDNALRVVVQRIQEELNYHSKEASRPGAICPLTDMVEKAIIQEHEFLHIQKSNFEKLIFELDKQMSSVEKTKNKIENDVINKLKTLSIDESCANKDYKNASVEDWKKKRKKGFTLEYWLKRCSNLKRLGLKALCSASITRQQVRGSRIQLSISAQAYAARVDAALRRRLSSNKTKIQDLTWQREEAVRDHTSLEEELATAEKSLLTTMDQERIVEARLRDRAQRPNRELIKDDVNKKLRNEQNQLRKFVKELRKNVNRIIKLQNDLSESIVHIDCYAEDLEQVIDLDEERMKQRQGEYGSDSTTKSAPIVASTPASASAPAYTRVQDNKQLTVIQEEDEDDYPFDY